MCVLGRYSFLSFDLHMFFLDVRCASVLSSCCFLPDLRACDHRQVGWFNYFRCFLLA
jgi:hypothetical protein